VNKNHRKLTPALGGTTMETEHYIYYLNWSAEDGEHVGLCAESPWLSWLTPNQDEALAGIRQLVADVVADLRARGEPMPKPARNSQNVYRAST
jgi:hypothetical protein